MSRYPRKPPEERLPLEQAPDFLTARDVSLVIGLSKGMVYELIREGKIPSFKLGSRVFVRKAEMARLGCERTSEP